MKKVGKFAFSLAAAGYLSHGSAAAITPPHPNDNDAPAASLFKLLRGEHTYTLAGHRSHSSHRSHGSHRSHRSSSGGSYFSGRYKSKSTPPAYVMPRMPQAPKAKPKPPQSFVDIPKTQQRPQTAKQPQQPLKTLPGNSSKFTKIIKQVQIALYAYGYYTGPIDGVFGPEMKSAISKFQKDWQLKITGTITPEVLDALGIVAK